MKITKDLLISDLIKTHPKVVRELFPKFDLDCIGCSAILTDTLEKAAINHGKDVNEIIKEIRKSIK
jgi:hybrid cluster-associated redox disulfide protein